VKTLPEHEPLTEVATRTSFVLLSDEPNREIVLGRAVVTPPEWRMIRASHAQGFSNLPSAGICAGGDEFPDR
jgi:hypothetical protein